MYFNLYLENSSFFFPGLRRKSKLWFYQFRQHIPCLFMCISTYDARLLGKLISNYFANGWTLAHNFFHAQYFPGLFLPHQLNFSYCGYVIRRTPKNGRNRGSKVSVFFLSKLCRKIQAKFLVF